MTSILKRPFVLLELVIAFALLSLSALPFIRHPLQHLRREIADLYVMELEREIDKELATLQIDLIQAGTIPEAARPLTLEIHLGNELSRSFKGNIYLKRTRHKIDREGREWMLIKANVEINGPDHKPIKAGRVFCIQGYADGNPKVSVLHRDPLLRKNLFLCIVSVDEQDLQTPYRNNISCT